MKNIFWVVIFFCQLIVSQNAFSEVTINKKQVHTQDLHFIRPLNSSKLLFPTKIPIVEEESQYFVVKVLLNGEGPYLFMVDTGTSFSIVSDKIAKELNLPLVKRLPFTINGKNQNVDCYHLNEIKIGDASLSNFDLIVLEEPSLVSQFIKEKKVPIVGILGYGAFSEYILTLDYAHKQIILESSQLNVQDKDTLSYFHDRFVPIISVRYENGVHKTQAMQFVVDSGFSGYFFMPALSPSMPFSVLKVKKKSVLTGLGVFPVVEHEIEANASFANQNVKSPSIMYGSEIYGKSASLYGLMGLKVINYFKISFDQQNFLIKIEKTIPSE